MICRHCQTRNVSRPRGLCWPCYYLPGVRDLYQTTSKYGRRGLGICRHARAAAYATDARPGSAEKIMTLMLRAELGQDLWHPSDATFGSPIPLGKAG